MTLIQDITIPAKTQICYHCGDACKAQVVFSGDLTFCCTGCRSVYEILNGCSLQEYYSIEKNPGIRPKDEASRFDFLELEEVRAQIIRFANDSIYKLKIFIPEIHCSSCIYLLEQLHRLEPEIQSSRVNFQRRELSVTVSRSEDALQKVFGLIARLGYTPAAPDAKNEAGLRDSRDLLVKIGITGFCFGNIMLLSIPEYLSGRHALEPQFERLFNILIILLIVPSLYFGAKDYFITAWKNLRHRFLSIDVPIVIGICALFARSLYEIVEAGEPGYFDSLAGFLFFLLIGKWFQSRTYEHLSFDKDFRSFLPLAVLGKVDGAFQPVRVNDLKRGDIIRLRNNEILPVNAQLLEESAEFDYSFVTGESALVVKKKKDSLFAGGRLNSPSAQFMVSEVVKESYLKDLWKEQDAKFRSSRLINLIDRISRRFTITIIAVGIAALAYWSQVRDWRTALEIFTAILIVACPCALALAAPFTYGNAARLLGRINVYLKNTSVIESLGRVGHIVFDKTGTLTRKNDTGITFHGQPLDTLTREHVAAIASCSIHPLSKALARHLGASKEGLSVNDRAEDLSEFTETGGAGLSAKIGGHRYFIGSLAWIHGNGMNGNSATESDGGRTRVYIGRDGINLGHFEFSNVYRQGALENVRKAAEHYNVSILSGDGNFEKEFLRSELGTGIDIRFGQSPDDKFDHISALRMKEKGLVMMLGDGINDAKALKASDIGVAITEDTGSFTPNSDIIMHADSLKRIPDILRFGRDSRNVLYFCLVISLLYNIIGLSIAFCGMLTPFVAAVLMPVSSVTVAAVATGLTAWFASKRKVSG